MEEHWESLGTREQGDPPLSFDVQGQLQKCVACACFPAFVDRVAVMTSRCEALSAEALMSGRIDVMKVEKKVTMLDVCRPYHDI